MSILVAGIGNVFLRDDGFGVAVARRLAEVPLPDGVKVADFGIRGVHLAYELTADHDLAIVVDAIPRGQAPGTLYVLEPVPRDASAGSTAGFSVDAHAMTPETVLALATTLARALVGPLGNGATDSPANDTVDRTVNGPTSSTTNSPVDNSVDSPASNPADRAVGSPAGHTMDHTASSPTSSTANRTASNPADSSASNPADRAVGSPADRAVGSTTDRAVGSPASSPVLLVGCEPADVSPGMELSPPVADAVDRAVDLVLELVGQQVGHQVTRQVATSAANTRNKEGPCANA